MRHLMQCFCLVTAIAAGQLEARKMPPEMLVIDHIEKVAVEN